MQVQCLARVFSLAWGGDASTQRGGYRARVTTTERRRYNGNAPPSSFPNSVWKRTCLGNSVSQPEATELRGQLRSQTEFGNEVVWASRFFRLRDLCGLCVRSSKPGGVIACGLRRQSAVAPTENVGLTTVRRPQPTRRDIFPPRDALFRVAGYFKL
jgi:hypothetical protein